MASKRSMYRPAPQDNVGQKRNRKPLAQGRLVANSGLPATHPIVVEAPADPGVTVPRSPYRSHVVTTPSKRGTGLTQGTAVRDDNALTPRRRAPKVTEHQSPKQSDRVKTLDLSDSDLDLSRANKPARTHTQQLQDVLMVDASRQTTDPNKSEVDILVGFERSPVKIICHSPAVVKSSLRDTGDVATARRVMVDPVPTVGTRGDGDLSQTHKYPYKSPRIVREDRVAGGHIDPHTAVEAIPVVSPLRREIPEIRPPQTRYPQPNFDDSNDSGESGHQGRDIPSHRNDQDVDDVQSVASDSDVCSLSEYVTQKPKTPSSVKKAPPKKVETVKKKKGRIVASRYMQAADKAKASLSAIYDKNTTHLQKSSNLASKSLDVPPTTKKMVEKQKTQPRHKSETDKPEAHTPDNSQVSSGGKTSTPTLDGSFFPQEIDASAIHAEGSYLDSGDHRVRNTPPPRSTGKTRSRIREEPRELLHDPFSHSVLSNTSVLHETGHRHAGKKRSESKISQQQLDLLYCRYLQWLFLESRAKKTLADQEGLAMAQLHAMWEEVEKLRKRKAEAVQELSHLRHLNMLDQQIDIQRQGLGPVVNNLPKLSKEYRSLAHALDTTRHQIPTKGIFLPEDEDQFQAKLESVLSESEQLLGELSVMIRQPTPGVNSMAKALSAMEKAVDNECHEMKRCQEMLSATQSLITQETSLRIQAIQAHEY